MSTTIHQSTDMPPMALSHLKVFAGQELCYAGAMQGEVELGRQRAGEPDPYAAFDIETGRRIIIAPLEDRGISRRHATLRVQQGGAICCANVSGGARVEVEGGPTLGPGEQYTAQPPLLLTLGDRLVRIEPIDNDESLAGLGRPTLPPGHSPSEPEAFRDVWAGVAGDNNKLIAWLRSTMEVFQSAASAPDFLLRAAKAVVSIVDLDVGAIIEPKSGDWRVTQADFASQLLSLDQWRPSRRMLDAVRDQKSTFRYLPGMKPFEGELSQPDIVSMVAAPILDAHGELLGVLYGEQRRASLDESRPPRISELEAMLVELIASGVAAGLARLEQEQAAVAARVRFEQFFTPGLAKQLQSDDRMLDGRDALVTVLFCDIRGFSRIAEQIGPEQTLTWIHDVMGELSECVLEEEGVLVDYQGDQLMAMWGAPVSHNDQALRACQAARMMLRRLPAIDERWEKTLGRPTRVGIGVNTGVARVGNIGSYRKFKYGPLGNAVNLAARVQTATRQIGVDLMLTGQTAEALPDDMPVRRICQARVVGINEPVDLYDLPTVETPEWRQMADKYAEALALAMAGDLHAAARVLAELVSANPNDGPALKLLARVVDGITDPDAPFDPVWELQVK